MKKLCLFAIIALSTINYAFAQQKSKTKHMTISIYETYSNWGKSPNVFITRDDTAQVQKNVQFNLHLKPKDEVPAHENQIMQILEPYYDRGWKLVTVSSVKDFNSSFYITRFFFTKG